MSEQTIAHPNCETCQRFTSCQNPFIESFGKLDPHLMIVSGYPGQAEDTSGIGFTGRPTMVQKKYEEEVGLSKYRIYRSYAVKCFGISGDAHQIPTDKEIKSCQPMILQEITEREPKLVLC